MTQIRANARIAKRIGTAIGTTYPNQSITTTPISQAVYAPGSPVPPAEQRPSLNNKPAPAPALFVLGTIAGNVPKIKPPEGYAWFNTGSRTQPQWTLRRKAQ